MALTRSLQTVAGQPSWRLASSTVELFVTRAGGQMAPVTFDRRGRKIRPFSIAPWAEEANQDPGLPRMLRALRGDFFCMPFGGNGKPYRNEQHPPHGETANNPWRFVSATQANGMSELTLKMRTRERPATVTKTLRLVDGHNAVYSRHEIAGASGPMNLGHHPMLKFPAGEGTGLVSTDKFIHGQVFPDPLERPDQGGYQSLKPGALFDTLTRVPLWNGGFADLSKYPARRGFEDLVTMVQDFDESAPKPLAWNAVVFPEQGYAYVALKDPRMLRQTILWMSNRGRHYAPWRGRHESVMGIEDVTSYFHEGLFASAKPNPFTRNGWPTTVRLSPKRPTLINYIMAIVPIPRGSKAITNIHRDRDKGIILVSGNKTLARAPLDVDFLYAGSCGL